MPEFPDRFGSIEDARAYCQNFFPSYNQDHHHSGIALLTPEMLHYGMAGEVISLRQKVLDAAYARNPERFTHARPKHPPQPTAAWINPPIPATATEGKSSGCRASTFSSPTTRYSALSRVSIASPQ